MYELDWNLLRQIVLAAEGSASGGLPEPASWSLIVAAGVLLLAQKLAQRYFRQRE